MLTKDDLNQIATIVQTAVHSTISTSVHDAVRSEVHSAINNTVGQEIASMRNLLGIHTLQLQALQVDMRSVKHEVRRTGVLMEDLETRFTALAEMVDDSLNNRNQVRDHETRITGLEQDQNSVRAILKQRFNS